MAQRLSEITLGLEHTYAEQLSDFCIAVSPEPASEPKLLQFNRELSDQLGINWQAWDDGLVAKVFSGDALPQDARPVAQAYAGHQFGHFVPQLGDGRALLLGEVVDRDGVRRDLALKGSGVTPFSRGGDGKAAVGPVLREYLISESMHALGIPTTRSLAAVATGDRVMRDRVLPGAVLTRVAASHVRVGTFQFFATRGQTDMVKRLADYVCDRHYPAITADDDRYVSLLQCVVERQAALIAKWMLVGFIHGVMNTDNMTVSGETIDYGPCAFMDAYDTETVFSSIDHAGRYAFANQPTVAVWNLARFAETLVPLIDERDEEHAVAAATSVLEGFSDIFQQHWYEGACLKLGMTHSGAQQVVDDAKRALIDDWFKLLGRHRADMTLAYRCLADAADGDRGPMDSMLPDRAEIDAWVERWRKLLGGKEPSDVANAIRSFSPIYIPRNHLVEEALAAAVDHGDLTPFQRLLEVVRTPYQENPEWEKYATPATSEFNSTYRTFCGT